MKFRRRVSEPQVIILDGYLPAKQQSWVGNYWQRVAKGLSSKSFWDSVLKLATGSSEPVIEQRDNGEGQTVYSIYDPITQQQVDGLSEAEVRTWLEQRYYQ
ncbi:hypothetical protein [Leptothoe sp. PORK10 BA2]|uniref:hypothetical protein n=1 Tax=Leptothoe sp. PORK10 BA2 TaxID=3110254 RepID=UPI002B1F120C|nr:hypothetical protein [Leptothoe sp. PORK10 BA2]MEA5466592.1 hypothetical protein [Leptothoe sp. PORK10 BA2]